MRLATRVLVLVSCWLSNSPPLLAHHGQFYKATFRAVQEADLDKIKVLFSERAWNGDEGEMSGPELQKRLKRSELVPLYARSNTILNEYASNDAKRSKCLVTFRLKFDEDKDRAEQIWLLAERVDFSTATNAKSWQIVRIVHKKKDAEQFLGKKLP